MKNCRDSVFSLSEMEAGVPAFQLPMFAKVTHCRKEICSTCLSKESTPFDPFVKSKPPLPTTSLSSRERQYVRQLCISLWLHHVAAAEKKKKVEKSCVMQRSIGLVTELWPPRFVTMQ